MLRYHPTSLLLFGLSSMHYMIIPISSPRKVCIHRIIHLSDGHKTTTDIFRKDVAGQQLKCKFYNELLYEKISIKEVKRHYNNIHLLANCLKHLLCMLPSSIFGDYHFEDLLKNIDAMNTKKLLNDSDSDSDVSAISMDDLTNLK